MIYDKIHVLRAKRLEFIDKIRSIITDSRLQDKEISYKKLIAVLCLDIGISKRNCRETINLMIEAGELILAGDILYPKKQEVLI